MRILICDDDAILAARTANSVRLNPLDANPAMKPYNGAMEHFYRDGLFQTLVTLYIPTGAGPSRP